MTYRRDQTEVCPLNTTDHNPARVKNKSRLLRLMFALIWGVSGGAEVGSSTERAYMEAFHIPQSHRGRRKARSMHRFQYILDSEVTPWVLKPTSYRVKVCNQQSTLRRTASTIQRGTEQSTEGCTWSTWQQQVHFLFLFYTYTIPWHSYLHFQNLRSQSLQTDRDVDARIH